MTDKKAIEVLHPSVVEKIAAGEVVERPASVLKELVENSIDAGASRVDVTVEESGFSMMRVSDNGCGMSRSDLAMCVLPHATSKIRSSDDLYSIATMGFRGEALASVGAVSRMTVASSDGGTDGLGHEITVEGGIHGEIRPAPRTRGTTVTVRDIFFNVPARKKFMKTARGEQIAIVKIMEQIAIPFPGIHFTVTVDGKKVVDLPAVATLRDRICSAAGNEFTRGLIECEGEGGGMSVLAYVSTPEKFQARPRFQSLYVNLRRIDNDSVTYAVREAFSAYLGHGNKPSFFCFLDVDPQRTDVNVHPTKQMMKFDDQKAVFGFIYHTVREGLRRSNAGLDDLTGADHADDGNNIPPSQYDIAGNGEDNIPSPKYDLSDMGQDMSQMILKFPSVLTDGVAPRSHVIGDMREAVGGQPWELIQCFQIHGMFILAPIKNGILLIDQHAAHERVLYEQALADFEAGNPVSQQLLFPIVLEMNGTEKAVLESGKNYFNDMGFEISDFGGNSVSVSALPAFLNDSRAEEAVRGMIRYLLEGRGTESLREPVKRYAAAFACGAAIKTGQKLSQEEMNSLINQLFSAQSPYTCPHGRPTLVRMSLGELERRFLRQGV